MKKIFLVLLIALTACSKEQKLSVNSVDNSILVRPHGGIVCACTDSAKKTYHVWVQLSDIEPSDLVRVKLVNNGVNINIDTLLSDNGDQNTKIKYVTCGVGDLKLNVVRGGTSYNCGTWTDLSCEHLCNVSGGTDCPNQK